MLKQKKLNSWLHHLKTEKGVLSHFHSVTVKFILELKIKKSILVCTTSLTYFVFVVFPQSLYLEPFFIIFECLFPFRKTAPTITALFTATLQRNLTVGR